MTMRELYQKVLAKPSDIQEHLGLLHGLAGRCDRVVEFGMRTGVSTIALCASGAEVISYDIADCSAAANTIKKHGANLTFRQQSSLEIGIPKCGMLFIDSQHDYNVLIKELVLHYGRVARWIVMHDTKKFGMAGQTKGDPGLLMGIDEFLSNEGHNWTTLLQLENNNGLTILERQ